MAITCSVGKSCGISCDTDACECSYPTGHPDDCACSCLQTQPAFSPTNKVKKISIGQIQSVKLKQTLNPDIIFALAMCQ